MDNFATAPVKFDLDTARPQPLHFPPTWSTKSIDRVSGRDLTQNDIDAAESNLARFRRLRDQHALDEYARKIPELREQARELRSRIGAVGWRMKLTRDKEALKKLEEKKVGLWWELQPIEATIAAMERDVPVREKRLAEMEMAIHD